MDEMALLRAADPARDVTIPPAQVRAVLSDILAAPASGGDKSGAGRRAKRPLLLAGIAASIAAVVIVGGVPWSGQSPQAAAAATPPLLQLTAAPGPADRVLDRLAEAARVMPATTGGAAHRVESLEWSLNSRITGHRVSSVVLPVRRTLKWNATGAGSLKVVVEAPVYVPIGGTGTARDWPATGTVLEEHEYTTDHPFAPQYGPPPSSAEAMLAYLGQGHPIDEYGTGELFVAVADLLAERTLTPGQSAAILSLIASRRDVSVIGTGRDRTGRDVIGIAAEGNFTGLPTKYVLLLDPSTGRILGQEQWLERTAGALDVRVPAVVSYTAWL